MRTSIYTTILLLAFLNYSCGDGKKSNDTAEPEVKTVEQKFEHKAEKIEASFKDENLSLVFTEYIDLKTALINSDVAAASQSAAVLAKAFANKGVDEASVAVVQKIVDSKDLEAQRSAFVGTTKVVEELLKDGLESGKLYKQYCPMAFNNTGAYWLSETKEIANPYFGEKMYRCGRIDSIIQ
ncbi:MAG: DUF3347 domain-containing protein [Flavobacterium sp.]|nr:MAG: DUF3347 domain-containing protein [Flavobacterium sp.]